MNLIIKPDPSPTGSGSDHDAFSSKRRNSIRSNGKIVKRKSRATKGTPTTFITADPSNFRQMVQQVTGIRLGNSHVPVNHVLKPEPQRPGGNRIQNCSLPTFDTSTFFIETNSNNNNNQLHQHLLGPTNAATTQAHVSFEPVTHGGVGLDLDTSRSFPTLESWRLM
ncbi:VQ [Macleaya cordata]|uniref:VQ n=1 Tax=Macleaya cordata TaxID=56857 RepID=A0A200R801_MACCD|nr:VQ [Macleaya cordata]